MYIQVDEVQSAAKMDKNEMPKPLPIPAFSATSQFNSMDTCILNWHVRSYIGICEEMVLGDN